LVQHEKIETNQIENTVVTPFSAAQPYFDAKSFYYIFRTGVKSILSKYYLKNYLDNSSVTTGKYQVKKSLLNAGDFMMTDITDNISEIAGDGSFFLTNPQPGSQKNILISKNYRTLSSAARYLGYNTSTSASTIKLEEKKLEDYLLAMEFLLKNQFNKTEQYLLKFIETLSAADTELKNTAYRKLAITYYRAQKFDKLLALHSYLDPQVTPVSIMLMLVNAYIENNDLTAAEIVLNSIKSNDNLYNQYLIFNKIMLIKDKEPKLFKSRIKEFLNLFKNKNACAEGLIFMEFMDMINIFD